jgi:protein N-terminal methyltransferase
MVQFLHNCRKGLSKDGVIVFKENIAQYTFIFDKEDCSITRTEKHFHWLFEEAGFDIVKEEFQKKFPKELFKVKMFAIKAKMY